jgi:anti-sigma-K factor RskA
MKHDDPQLIDTLAAEYVLGTLGGRARRRFERWRAREWHVERRVQAWEERLVGLALRLRPVKPSSHVWARIEQRIGESAAAGTRPRRAQPVPLRPTESWRALAAGLVVFTVVLGGFGAWRLMQGPRYLPMATVVNPAETAPAWELHADAGLRHLRAIARGGVTAQAGRSFELWALPDDGGPPVSLGLMPESGQIERKLTRAQRAALESASKVAVSLEPSGGSPTGAPTGPVLFVADRIKRA